MPTLGNDNTLTLNHDSMVRFDFSASKTVLSCVVLSHISPKSDFSCIDSSLIQRSIASPDFLICRDLVIGDRFYCSHKRWRTELLVALKKLALR